MNVLFLIGFLFGIIVSLYSFPVGTLAAFAGAIMATAVVLIIKKVTTDPGDREFLVKIFVAGLLARAILGFIIYFFNLERYFGPDAWGYHLHGMYLAECWARNDICQSLTGENFGMLYFVTGVYYLIGPNPLIIQFFSAVIGSATGLIIFFLTQDIFSNKRVSYYSAILVTFLPAMCIFSAQLLKDGFIVFLLALIMWMVTRLQKRFSYFDIAVLLIAILGIWFLRFYLFYIVGAAVVGGLLLGANISMQSLIRRAAIFLIAGFTFLVIGAQQIAERQLDTINLQRVQLVRRALQDERTARSAVDYEIDVSTPIGAITTVPVGIVTILMSPFPWQMRSITQLMTLPEMLFWWGLFPFMFMGIKYCIKYRLRGILAVFLFSLSLLLACSLFQGNLGMIYRQRTQIQVFLLVFAAVGIVLYLERQEMPKLRFRR